LVTAQQTPTADFKIFANWCLNKTSLSPDTQLTISLLLEQAGTKDCSQANQNLSDLTELQLNPNFKRLDLSPVQSLTKLTRFQLKYSESSDITPLKF
jgi:internalin A